LRLGKGVLTFEDFLPQQRRPKMTDRNRSGLASILGALSLVAVLAFAGPATATDSSRDDDDPAGKIASFDAGSGKLVIDLARGGTIGGIVTARTWIDDGGEGCERRAHRRDRRAFHGDSCERRFSGDHGDHHWPDGPDGDVSDLVEGAVVEDAILILKDGRALYAKVDLED
jgi:hypothetical protein